MRQVPSLPRGYCRMLDILNRICDGHGTMEDIEHLEELSQVIIDTSFCQLGGTAPNPVLLHHPLLPPGVHRPRSRQALSGRRLQGTGGARHRRDLHRLSRLCQGLPDRRDCRRTQGAARDRSGQVHPVRRLLPGLPLRLDQARQARRRRQDPDSGHANCGSPRKRAKQPASVA